MNKEILKRNIEQVIMQPCLSQNGKGMTRNGLSKDGTYILVKCKPDDTSSTIYVKELDFVEEILERLPKKFRENLVTLQHQQGISYSYLPVFDTDTQTVWDSELDKFYDAKQDWCDYYGCD